MCSVGNPCHAKTQACVLTAGNSSCLSSYFATAEPYLLHDTCENATKELEHNWLISTNSPPNSTCSIIDQRAVHLRR